jgi:murein L,D-transpeptidase YcbB/YkuD
MSTTTTQKVEAVAVTATATAVGFMTAGPVGAGVGFALGALVDLFLLRQKSTPLGALPVVGAVPPVIVAQAMVPGAPALPPGANLNAATKAVLLMRQQRPDFAPAAKGWLVSFQTSVGLPATGSLDPATRALLVVAVPEAATVLPAVTILG